VPTGYDDGWALEAVWLQWRREEFPAMPGIELGRPARSLVATPIILYKCKISCQHKERIWPEDARQQGAEKNIWA